MLECALCIIQSLVIGNYTIAEALVQKHRLLPQLLELARVTPLSDLKVGVISTLKHILLNRCAATAPIGLSVSV